PPPIFETIINTKNRKSLDFNPISFNIQPKTWKQSSGASIKLYEMLICSPNGKPLYNKYTKSPQLRHSFYYTVLFEHWQRIQCSKSTFILRNQSSLLNP